MTASRFRLGRLDHVHIRVPDRAEAAVWYGEHLGFEPVAAFDFWASGFDGGPLQISADGGATTLALFEASDAHPMEPLRTGVAFSVEAGQFAEFVRSLPGELRGPSGDALTAAHVVDLDLCWAIDLADPWGNVYELNSYDYDTVRTDLIEADGIVPQRYWPPSSTVPTWQERIPTRPRRATEMGRLAAFIMVTLDGCEWVRSGCG